MAISFRCDGCGRSYKTEEKFLGRTVSCKGCGRSLVIRAAEPGPDVYGLEEAAPLPPRAASTTASSAGARPAPAQPSRAKGEKTSSEFSFLGLKGALGGAVVVILIVLRVISVINRSQRQDPAPAPAPLAIASTVAARPAPAGGAQAPTQWTMPTLPPLGPWNEIEPGVKFQEVKLPSPAGPETMPGHSGKIWVYLPSGEHRPQSLPCVLVTGAGSRLFTGMNLGDGDRAEHLPYARAGFVVVAYEMDGFPPKDENAPDSAYAEPTGAFFRAQAGVVNAKVAIQFVITRLQNEVDLNKLYVAGHSSAATAALLVAAYDPRVKGCAAFAPAIDMDLMFPPNLRPIIEKLSPGVRDLFTLYNPRAVENRINCPLLLFYAEDDDRFSGQVKEMADRLKAQGRNVTLLAAASGGHYQSMIEEGIPNAIGWFTSLGGGDPWVPLGGAAGPNRNGPPRPKRGINPPGFPRGRLGPGMPRGPAPGSPFRRPGMNRPGG